MTRPPSADLCVLRQEDGVSVDLLDEVDHFFAQTMSYAKPAMR